MTEIELFLIEKSDSLFYNKSITIRLFWERNIDERIFLNEEKE
jgi:hypothetical protein